MQEIFNNQFVNGSFQRWKWIQDAALDFKLLVVTERLPKAFDNHMLTIQHKIEWPPLSPDLTPCDSFLWSFMKLEYSPHLYWLSLFCVKESEGLARTNFSRIVVRAREKRFHLCIKNGAEDQSSWRDLTNTYCRPWRWLYSPASMRNSR